MRVPALFIAVILLVTLITGCGKTVGDTFDDATVTTRVKIVLINDPVIRADRIEVATFKGVVTLSGRVNTKQEEEKAIALARTVRGVKEVKSTLQIQ